MLASLCKLLPLPDDTVVYCAHEYTEANARFALSVEPDNAALTERWQEIQRLRGAGRPTVPTTLGLEKATNPFLRWDSPGLRQTLGLTDADAVTVFAEPAKQTMAVSVYEAIRGNTLNAPFGSAQAVVLLVTAGIFLALGQWMSKRTI